MLTGRSPQFEILVVGSGAADSRQEQHGGVPAGHIKVLAVALRQLIGRRRSFIRCTAWV